MDLFGVEIFTFENFHQPKLRWLSTHILVKRLRNILLSRYWANHMHRGRKSVIAIQRFDYLNHWDGININCVPLSHPKTPPWHTPSVWNSSEMLCNESEWIRHIVLFRCPIISPSCVIKFRHKTNVLMVTTKRTVLFTLSPSNKLPPITS